MASRVCTVSFEDISRISHSVEVVASSLYEAAVLAMKEFSSCSLVEVGIGRTTSLKVTVKAPAESHDITVGQVEDWLQSMGNSPKEHMTKKRLAEVLRAGKDGANSG